MIKKALQFYSLSIGLIEIGSDHKQTSFSLKKRCHKLNHKRRERLKNIDLDEQIFLLEIYLLFLVIFSNSFLI
jgi:hypothetical protein